MANWRDLGNIWTTFKEIDIRPIAQDAEFPTTLAVIGAKGVGKSTLIAALRHNNHAHEKTITPVFEAGLDVAGELGGVDLVVLVLDATRNDFAAEVLLFNQWRAEQRNVLVFYNKMDGVIDMSALSAMTPWSGLAVASGSAIDPDSLNANFIPRVLDALPDAHLSMARHYPLFRLTVSRKLIGDTSIASASYALTTGLGQLVPVLDIPFTVADVMILTKNQALMVYKLGLMLGLSTRWQDHVAELGGVVGAGFLWRQIARELIGLIPGWGILPKVAVAYAGTYAVGEAILRWYQTGRKVSGSGMRDLYTDALARGKQIAQNLIDNMPRPGMPALPKIRLPALPHPNTNNVCPRCGKKNPSDAKFCAYCGTVMH
jgi:uncharacterized protein (DUF697 family)